MEDNEKIKKLEEKAERLKEKAKAERFKQETNNNDLLDRNGVIAVNKGSYVFFKVMSVLFLLIIVTGFAGVGYLIYSGQLDGLIQNSVNPVFYSQINNTFKNDFNPTTNNQYRHDIYNNITIINKIGNSS